MLNSSSLPCGFRFWTVVSVFLTVCRIAKQLIQRYRLTPKRISRRKPFQRQSQFFKNGVLQAVTAFLPIGAVRAAVHFNCCNRMLVNFVVDKKIKPRVVLHKLPFGLRKSGEVLRQHQQRILPHKRQMPEVFPSQNFREHLPEKGLSGKHWVKPPKTQ